MLTMFAIFEAMSKRVGNSSFLMYEFTEACDLDALERCLQILNLSGAPGSWGWTETTMGDDWNGPRRISSTCSRENGPDILPEEISLRRYSSTTSRWP